MFIPHARVHIAGIAYWKGSKGKGGQSRRRLGMREILRMPCLMPTAGVVLVGLIILAGGAGMSVLGYIPDTVTTVSDDGNTTTVTMVTRDARYYATKSLSYAGPVLMGCGFFAIIVSCVLYCEIVDRYTVIMPKKPDSRVRRRDLMDMILSEFKKSYFRGIEVPLRKLEPAVQQKGEREKETLLKALSISTPVLLMSPDLAPTWRFSHHAYQYPGRRHMALKPRHPKLKQLGGSSGSSGHEPWLKTSSLPNICDPDIRRHDLPRPVPLDTQEVTKIRRLKRFGRPCRSMDNRISWSLPHTLSRSTTGVDNPAYLHEQDRKKSLSMCVHPDTASASAARRPQARFVKASQMQPRVRLLQQHQQQMQKQQQLQQKPPQQQQQQQQKQHHHQSKQKPPQLQHSQDSTESVERRQCESDQSRPRQRPKLVRTKAAHASFDVSDASFVSLLPVEPPPFPLPAHFMAKKPGDSLSVLSPRTAKLLQARAKSEEAKEKKRPEMILLKDLFRSFDVHDDALLSVSPVATTSSAPGSTAAMVHFDPLAGQKCEVVRPASWGQQTQKDRGIKNDIGAVATALPAGPPSAGAVRRPGDRASSESPGPAPVPAVTTVPDDQCYQLPLLSGVLRSHSQCDVKQRTNIIRCSRETEKSLSLDTKDRVPGLEVKRPEVQRAHSFNVTDFDADLKAGLTAGGHVSKKAHPDKGSLHKLRVFGAPSHKTRPKSWDGDKSYSLDGADLEKGTSSTLTVPRLDRANSFEPLGSKLKQCNLSSQGSAFEDQLHSCSFRVDDETRTGKNGSDEIRQKTPIPTVTLTVPLPSVFIQPPVENHKTDKLQAGRKQHRLKKQPTVVPNPLYHQHKETKEKQCVVGSDRSQKSIQPPAYFPPPCEGDASQKPTASQGPTQAKVQHVQHVAQKQRPLQQEQSASIIIHRAAVHLPADCAAEKRAAAGTAPAAVDGRGQNANPAVVPHLPPPPPSPSTPLFPTVLLLPSTSCAVSSPLPPLAPTPRLLLPSPASSVSSPVSPSPASLFVPLPPPASSPSSACASRLTPTSMLLSKASALLQSASTPASSPAASRPATPSPASATTTTTTPPTAGTPTTLSTSLSVDGGVSGCSVHGAGSRRPVSPLAMRNRLRTRSVAVEESSVEEEYTENTPLIQTPGVHSSGTCSSKPQ